MSIRVSTWAWDQQIPPNGKLVLMVLADHAHDNGTNAYPSVALVARKTGYSPRQIQRILAELVNTGVIRVQRLGGRGNQRPTTYALNIDGAFTLQRGEFRAAGCDADLRLAVIERDKHTCQLCSGAGDEVVGPDGATWEIDRITAGGSYEDGNVRLSCRTCNRRRGPGRQIVAPGTADLSARGDMGDLDGATGVSPEPSYEPSLEPSTPIGPPDGPALVGVADGPKDPMEVEFEGFWRTYPRRVGKPVARRAYRAARKDTSVADIAAGLRSQLPDMARRDVTLVPHPATWLNQRRWEDDPAHTSTGGQATPWSAGAERGDGSLAGVVTDGKW